MQKFKYIDDYRDKYRQLEFKYEREIKDINYYQKSEKEFKELKEKHMVEIENIQKECNFMLMEKNNVIENLHYENIKKNMG